MPTPPTRMGFDPIGKALQLWRLRPDQHQGSLVESKLVAGVTGWHWAKKKSHFNPEIVPQIATGFPENKSQNLWFGRDQSQEKNQIKVWDVIESYHTLEIVTGFGGNQSQWVPQIPCSNVILFGKWLEPTLNHKMWRDLWETNHKH